MKKIHNINTILHTTSVLFILLLSFVATTKAQTFTNNYDIASAINLCKSPTTFTQFGNDFTVTQLNGSGINPNEVAFPNSNIRETNSSWYTFTIATSGTLKMKIKPLETGYNDDIDFMLWAATETGTFANPTRISLNGPVVNRQIINQYCNGKEAGLKDGESFVPEMDGCQPINGTNSNGYVMTVNATVGQKYRLFINNWYVNRGFYIDFSGSTCQFTSCTAAPLTVNISGVSPQTICNGNATTLVATASGGTFGNYSYAWSPSVGLNATNTSTVIANPTVNTTYTVTATDAAGTKATKSVVVNVSNLAVGITNPNSAQVCPGINTTISANPTGGNNTYTYLWSNGQTAQSINVAPQTSTTYTVTVSSANCTKIGSTSLTVVNSPNCNINSKIANNQSNVTINTLELRLAPNPTTAIFTATIQQIQKQNVIFELYDYSGRLLEKYKSDEESIQHQARFDLTNKPSGIYYVKARNNSEEVTKSIVKQ